MENTKADITKGPAMSQDVSSLLFVSEIGGFYCTNSVGFAVDTVSLEQDFLRVLFPPVVIIPLILYRHYIYSYFNHAT
jgi:hypothetical protein